ncbi:biliverdin-producing heme oxygenase [candidate division KSB1 bacterium]|nr:biliverdin-producing heme oxygenase [candidate division KSB1 bacterium]NIR73441.1 biliverdin-producing heme oxygenase [candidate division KSB1 bacterium]NIS28432.1 biliverdin-producing heme oxygenase [candidate division KSB1 bacterium]NIT75312.1 biliverdin-producing heme oxygenase [candidate division KSB1 bacterium]NIU29160.1 biliverdin-producing heme oxygenase [candidate division KSB1 bacterium]
MDRLKIETREHHQYLESLPFFTILMEEKLPLESYVGLLRAMAVVHAVLEHELPLLANPVISAVWQEEMRRLPFLEKDLSFIETKNIGDVPEAAKHALQLAEKIRLWSTPNSVNLLGCLYVLEGSTLGAQVLRPKIAKLFNLRTEGLSYLSSYGNDTAPRWKKFKQRMNAVDLSEQQRKTVVETAHEVFQGMTKIVSALYPIELNSDYFASTLNPEAGVHPVTNDPRELFAAIDAGNKTWNAYPYFKWRYGDRGKRFTKSDSAWLVTLSNLPQDSVHHEVEWLGKVLASRGMPQFLLQKHLENLYQALVKSVPERRDKYDKLLKAAEKLQTARRNQISDTLFETLTEEFERMVGPSWSKRLNGAGAILVAAVADEQAGIKKAVTSLEEWMTDSSRFPKKWIDAVQVILRKTRRQPPDPPAPADK